MTQTELLIEREGGVGGAGKRVRLGKSGDIRRGRRGEVLGDEKVRMR